MDAQPRELTTAAEVFGELGDLSGVVSITGRRYGAVCNWKIAGKFPANTFVVLQDALRERGFTAPASLWGMVSTPEAAE